MGACESRNCCVREDVQPIVEVRLTATSSVEDGVDPTADANELQAGEADPARDAMDEMQAMDALQAIFRSAGVEASRVSKRKLAAELRAGNKLESIAAKAEIMPASYVLEQLDSDSDGRISWLEFREIFEFGKITTMNLLQSIFSKIDADSEGRVNKAEFTAALRKEIALAVILEKSGLNSTSYVLEQLDANGDDKVSWREFQSVLRTGAQDYFMQSHVLLPTHRV